MRLFQILTRCVATGKRKVTRKLLDQVRREADGKPCSKPSAPHKRKSHDSARWCYASLLAALVITVSLGVGHAVTMEHSMTNIPGKSGYSAASLFNQANAFARNGKTGPAVLDYERALLLAPNNANIVANLYFVRAKAGLPNAPESWFAQDLSFARPNTLAWLGSVGFLLAGLSLILGRLRPQRRLAFRSLAVVGALVAATVIGSAINTWPKMQEAIVITSETPARNSPVLNAEPAFKLSEGAEVMVRAQHQGFTLVQTLAGRSGWVARTDIARVVPQSGGQVQPTNRT
jgi:hypothetical protein